MYSYHYEVVIVLPVLIPYSNQQEGGGHKVERKLSWLGQKGFLAINGRQWLISLAEQLQVVFLMNMLVLPKI